VIGLVVGTMLPGTAVHRATLGFLCGAVAAAAAFAILLTRALRAWPKPPNATQFQVELPHV
jgi:hypothetical protein